MLRLLPIFLASPALAEVTVTDARLAVAFQTAKAGAVYAAIGNTAETDALIGVYSPEAMTMIHETVEEDGVMKMTPIERLELPTDDVEVLRPGGPHVMVMGLTPEMLQAETLPLVFIFEEAGEVALDVPIEIGVGEKDEGETE